MKVVDAPEPRSREAATGTEGPQSSSGAAGPDEPALRPGPRQKRRRPYAPPALETTGGFAPVTLGTKNPVLPGQGC